MTNNAARSLPGSHNIRRVVLENGVTILVYENHATQSVVLGGLLRAGSVFEPPQKSGLAAITASALMRGTEHRDFDTINSTLEDIGADVNLSGGVHRTSFWGKSLAEDLPTLVDILADVVRYPAFPAAHVERLRGEIITGLQIRQHDTRYRANRAFSEALYPPNHPYCRSARGSLQTVPFLTIEEMRQFHQTHFGPAGMILVVVGAVDTDAALDTLRTRLGDWRNGAQPEAPPLPPLPPLETTRRVMAPLPGKTQTDIVLGAAGPPRKAPDYTAANVANSILGQFGLMGRIGIVVREELGLAYYASSHLDGGYGPGPWSISAGVSPANVERAVHHIREEVRRLATEPVGDDDLADNQAYFIGHLPLQLESNEGIASAILNLESYELGLDYLVSYRDTISALTKEAILAAAQRYLNPDALVIAVAGPEPSADVEALSEDAATR